MNKCLTCESTTVKKWYSDKTKCEKCYRKEWYQKNKDSKHQIDRKRNYYKKNSKEIIERSKEYNSDYYQNNKERLNKASRKRYQENKGSLPDRSEKNKKYYNNRYKNDINFKIKVNLRNRLNNAIKNNQKTGSAVSDLGCSIDEFKIHIEAQFQKGMTWGNWSKKGWHIDHIKPLVSFDLANREEFLKAVHYSNLQPLWATDNLKKSDSI